jgi:hypothetical protein
MALRDAVKSPAGAKAFAEGLFEFLYGTDDMEARFTKWCAVISKLPRRQTRVLTWPLVTVFGFIAQPEVHFFLKPMVTRRAADEYGFAFEYRSRPNWEIYRDILKFARKVSRDLRDLRPRDMIDIHMKRQPQHRPELEGMHPVILLGAPLVIIAVFMAIVRTLT